MLSLLISAALPASSALLHAFAPFRLVSARCGAIAVRRSPRVPHARDEGGRGWRVSRGTRGRRLLLCERAYRRGRRVRCPRVLHASSEHCATSLRHAPRRSHIPRSLYARARLLPRARCVVAGLLQRSSDLIARSSEEEAMRCKRRSHMTLRPCFNSLDSAGPPASARRSTLPPRVRGRRSELERAGARECGTPHKRAQQSAPTQHDAGRLNNQQPREETRRQSRAAAVPLVLPLRESGVMRVTSESASRRAADDAHDTRSTAQTRRLQSTLGKDTHAG